MGNIHPSINKRIHVARIFSKKIINFKIQIHPVEQMLSCFKMMDMVALQIMIPKFPSIQVCLLVSIAPNVTHLPAQLTLVSLPPTHPNWQASNYSLIYKVFLTDPRLGHIFVKNTTYQLMWRSKGRSMRSFGTVIQ